MPASVRLTAKAERRLKSGHPWIYRDEIAGGKPEFHGSVVAVNDKDGGFFAYGFYSHESKIAVRIVARSGSLPDRGFFQTLAKKAGEKRKGRIKPQSAARLINAEGDLLPGLIADWYCGQVVVQCLIPGVDKLREMFAEILWDEFQPRGLRFRNDASGRELEGLALENFFWRGKEEREVVIEEGRVKFLVDLAEGHKTGSYLDQADNRIRAEDFAGCRCLDAFCFQGGFSLHLAKTSEQVVAIDSSAPALSVLEKNMELNGIKNVQPVRANIFDALPRLAENGERFDLVILDPPPFAKSKKDLGSAAKGYYELNRRAVSLLKPGGKLLTYSCSFHFGLAELLSTLQKACADGGRNARLIEIQKQADDHPVLLAAPETWYLKGLVAEIS